MKAVAAPAQGVTLSSEQGHGLPVPREPAGGFRRTSPDSAPRWFGFPPGSLLQGVCEAVLLLEAQMLSPLTLLPSVEKVYFTSSRSVLTKFIFCASAPRARLTADPHTGSSAAFAEPGSGGSTSPFGSSSFGP